MIRFLFKQRQPKQFAYKPRFYDERKEFLESRVRAVRAAAAESSQVDEALRSKLRSAWRGSGRAQAVKRSNLNVLVIAALLFILVFIILR